jgi:DNA-binding winged helix-turn-helix (wHTH) protein
MATLTFGPCALDLDARRLTRDGQTVHLSPKAFELLRILISGRPKAFSKAELHEQIWPGTFVTDDSLARLVAETRAAIGDQAKNPDFLQTFHAYGYGFSDRVQERASGRARPVVASRCWVVVDGRTVVLAIGENLVGREPTVEVLLDSVRVSRRHAKIIVIGETASIEDLGSRNGTIVNGARLDDSAALSDGDEIVIGGFVIRFRSGDETPTVSDVA